MIKEENESIIEKIIINNANRKEKKMRIQEDNEQKKKNKEWKYI